MKQKTTILTFLILFMMSVLLPMKPHVVFAQDTPSPFGEDSLLETVGDTAGYNTGAGEDPQSNLLELLGTIIFTLLSLLGIFFLGLTIYGGFRWMFARGNEDEVTKGKNIIKNAVIGLIIVSGSYAIWLTIANVFF